MNFYLIFLMFCILIKNTYSLPLTNENEIVYSPNADEEGDYYEGDMILNDDQKPGFIQRGRNGVNSEKYIWPEKTVYVEFDKIFDKEHKMQIITALKLIEKETCVRFEPKTTKSKDYIFVTGESKGCFAHVGRGGGKQNLNLEINKIGKKCFKLGTIIHEFVHALGFHHQQCASDRDKFVEIIEKNIKPKHLKNFKKYDEKQVTDFGVEYDYGSIMHYSQLAFSMNGKATIVPVDKTAKIGQRNGLSEKDIAKINLMYKCY